MVPSHTVPADPDRCLELTGEGLVELLGRVGRRLAAHLDALDDLPSWEPDGAQQAARAIAGTPLPEGGIDAEEALDLLFDRLIEPGFQTAGPGYLAFIPGGGLPEAAVADLIAGTLNRFVGVWEAVPGLAELETTVVRWFCDLMGYPAAGGGFLTTGGSLANWSALVTARRCRLGDDLAGGVLYASDQAHHSVTKAAVLAGFAPESVRVVPTAEDHGLRVDALAEAVRADRAEGRRPFLVCATAGTTNTGAIDDLDAVADLARAEGLWMHVDAAYGGFFTLTERGAAALKGIERSDSVTLDPHKGLFLPYGTGCLLARDVEDLRRTHSVAAAYMPDLQEGERVDFCEISPELSRDCRGLRVWLPIALHGIGPFRENLDEKLDLARWAADELREVEGLELVAEPRLSLVAFRIAGEGPKTEERNRALLERVNARKRFFITPTLLDGRFTLRICVLSFRTHLDRVRECVEAVREETAALLSERSAP
ncbi:MAG: aminotransferase class I/II-fold pyridoxal phosphate-dependent enzyme [Planctomycetota bacterium]|jgi:aromatic-L-amino-acid decarboxylase|nr:aminotransferase class I/II-fold pyridoxal phosphate-dependent enzyme [Planctomycetota bacterium]MDP6761956.1 aminotransferase class I/II-fold pyridoxal phosphate-dependent enzyme [Planctomycetota bacterium]MDP6990726.1 aminotransferase class I/II-fold pyridoxal phosphate-dependent enzyme [Planctomycetota bacterium]